MTARDALDAAIASLEAAGCMSPRLDAELLIADALGVGREQLFLDPDMEIPPPAARTIAEHVRRRNEREPVAYILGRKGFRNIELKIDPRVLCRGRRREMLVEAALDAPGGRARARRRHRLGGDRAGAARRAPGPARERLGRVPPARSSVARENAELLGLPLEIEIADGLPPGDYDLVIANLPVRARRRVGDADAGDQPLRAARAL